MKNILLLFVAFLILGAGTYWLLENNKKTGNASILPAERDFAVKNVADIGKIFLVDRSNNQTVLERIGDSEEWTFNKKYKARANAMENLLRAIREIEVRYQPAEAALDNIIRSISSKGIKVEIYDKKGKKMKAYYIGGAPSSELGTFAIIDGAEQPYVIHIPTFSGNVRFRYNLKGDDWRDRHIFDTRPEDIQEVTVEYPKQKNKSYRIIKKAKGYDVLPFFDISPTQTGQPDLKKIENYLSFLPQKQFMGFENRFSQKDVIEKNLPFCKIKLKTTDGKEQSLTVWPQWDSPAIDPKSGKELGKPNVTRYFARVNGKDFVSLTHSVVGDFFGAYDNFFK